jgi:hypothetical protein
VVKVVDWALGEAHESGHLRFLVLSS